MGMIDADFDAIVAAKGTDDPIYSASPSMFRMHPIRFVLGIGFGAIMFLLGVMLAADKNRQGNGWMIPLGIAGLIAIRYLLWWLGCRAMRLTVTPRKISLRSGILSRRLNEVRIGDVRNVRVDQGAIQRMLGVGSIGVSTAGQSDVEIQMSGVPNPNRVREIIDVLRG